MKQRTRIYYSDSQKALMWERWKKGESLEQIAPRGRPCVGVWTARSLLRAIKCNGCPGRDGTLCSWWAHAEKFWIPFDWK